MENKMTEISTIMYNKAMSENITIDDAVKLLKECADFRTLSKKIEAYAKGRDVKKLLIDGLCENHPDAKPDSVSKKVRNWLNDNQGTLYKEDAIELCFILELTLEESDKLIAMICDEALHWRNLDEIPYIFALSKNMSYKQAVQLHEKIKSCISEKESNASTNEPFTSIVKNEIKNINDEEELINYVLSTKNKLGALHNTAYTNFIEMIEALENPETELFDDNDYYPSSEKYSINTIVQSYLHREEIEESDKPEDSEETKKRKSIQRRQQKSLYSDLQKVIVRNWPNEAVLSNMKNRKTDITRKVIILLFFATFDYEPFEDDKIICEKPANEIFKDFYDGMNNMLTSCGFKELDPRSPFDWIILYCMCEHHSYNVEDEFYEIDKTLSEFLKSLFPREDIGNEF